MHGRAGGGPACRVEACRSPACRSPACRGLADCGPPAGRAHPAMSASSPHGMRARLAAALRHEAVLAVVALQYFTRLPVPTLRTFDPAWLNAAVRYFPLAGLAVGLIGAAVLWLSAQVLPMPLAALLALAATAAATGAFHEDGLADTFDALGGHVERSRALEIMRDSRIGTYGALASIFGVLVRWQALAALPLALAVCALLCLHPLARAAAASLMASLPYVRLEADAKAKPVAQSLPTRRLAATLAVGLAPLAATLGAMSAFGRTGSADSTWVAWAAYAWPLLAGAAAAGIVRGLCARWFRARLGGYTGDTLGACEQLCEAAFLLAALAVCTALQA